MRIKFLAEENKRLHEMVKAEKRKNQGLTAKLAEKEKFAPSSSQKDNLITCLAPCVTKPALEILNSQLHNHGREPRGRRFTDELKIICYGLQKGAPKVYKSLSNIFTLPTEKTLELLQQNVVVETGLCQAVLDTLQQQVGAMTVLEKETVLCLDEMSLKTFLSFRESVGLLEGFVDYGPLGRHPEYGNEALVFHLHGMYKAWKQPIGYVISNSATPAEIMYAMLQKAVKAAQEMGLRIRVLVSDQGTNNQALLSQHLNVTANKPYFHMNGQKIITIYDPPHLLKSVRNNLVGKDFIMNGNRNDVVASWDHFTKLIEIETQSSTAFRLAPKLTASRHGNPTAFKKMKVSTAAQTFSSTVAAAMTTYAVSSDSCMPIEAASTTASTFKKFDSLFDSFNSSQYLTNKEYNCALTKDSPHHEFLDEMRNFFQKVKVVEKRPWMKSFGRISRPPCFRGWVISINALQELWKDIEGENGVHYLCTRKLTQDPLENLFGVIRRAGGNRDNPTVGLFRETFRYVMVSDVLDLHHSKGANCEMDIAKHLFQLSGRRPMNSQAVSAPKEPTNSEAVDMVDLPDDDGHESAVLDLPDEEDDIAEEADVIFPSDQTSNNADGDLKTAEEQMMYYFSGRCANKFQKFHSKSNNCDCVKKVSIDPKSAKFSDKDQFYTYMKAYKQSVTGDGFGGLTVPSVEFVKFILQCNQTFKDSFDKYYLSPNLDRVLLSHTDTSFPGIPAQCRPALVRTVRYFIRTRIYYICKNVNAKLSSLPSTKQSRKMVKVTHQ